MWIIVGWVMDECVKFYNLKGARLSALGGRCQFVRSMTVG
jgi:hypothetical protein